MEEEHTGQSKKIE